MQVSVGLDGTGKCRAETPIHFLNHMLDVSLSVCLGVIPDALAHGRATAHVRARQAACCLTATAEMSAVAACSKSRLMACLIWTLRRRATHGLTTTTPTRTLVRRFEHHTAASSSCTMCHTAASSSCTMCLAQPTWFAGCNAITPKQCWLCACCSTCLRHSPVPGPPATAKAFTALEISQRRWMKPLCMLCW